jgi:hypothetical protein
MIVPGAIEKTTEQRTEIAVPMNIIELAAQAISAQNDGYVREISKQKLIEIRDYINNALTQC